MVDLESQVLVREVRRKRGNLDLATSSWLVRSHVEVVLTEHPGVDSRVVDVCESWRNRCPLSCLSDLCFTKKVKIFSIK